ncbi:hypothetical protein YC2023_011760 [Brassica napus]
MPNFVPFWRGNGNHGMNNLQKKKKKKIYGTMCKLKKFRVNMKIAKIPGTCSENIQKVGWKRADQPDRSILVLFETKDKRCGLTLRVLGFIKLMSNSLLSD